MNIRLFAVAAAALLAIGFPSPGVQAAPANASLRLLAEGLTSPVAFAPLPDKQALIVDQVGFVRLLDREGKLVETPVLNLTNRLSAINHGSFDERGFQCLV